MILIWAYREWMAYKLADQLGFERRQWRYIDRVDQLRGTRGMTVLVHGSYTMFPMEEQFEMRRMFLDREAYILKITEER